MTKRSVFRYTLIVILVFQLFVNESNAKKDTTDFNIDDKRVFDIYFDDKQTYTIDNCIPLAFGDLNADKNVDIFCRNTKGDTLHVMLNSHRSPTTIEQCQVKINGTIFDALAADFDGDSQLDVFLLYKTKFDQIGYNGGMLWGNRVNLDALQPFDYVFESSPTVLDANGDSYVELLGMISTNNQTTFKPGCLYFENHRVPYLQYLPNIDNLRPKSTQATADLNNDLVAELFLTHEINNTIKFRIYNLPISQLTLIDEYDPPDGVAICYLSTFVDLDADGQLEHVLPVCMDTNCTDSRIYVRDDKTWYQIAIVFGDGIRFPLPSELPFPLDTIPLSIKIADYNLDGYPDAVVVMKQSFNNNTIAIVLQNRACPSNLIQPGIYNRTLLPQTEETFVSAITNATLAVFFDILENGYPDLLVLEGSDGQIFRLIGFRNSLVQDVNFIKVMVISSFVCDTCSRQMRLPYGDNQPGQSMLMQTVTTMNGITDYPIQLAAVQMAQAGQLSLELPYIIMGLGAIPNFVDELTIGLPPNNISGHLIRTFTQMIPNSQIVIVPSPLMNPEKWQSKLFITPSGMIILTGIALAVTLVILAIVLGVLQYYEKVEDDQERKLQAQSFHYDAL